MVTLVIENVEEHFFGLEERFLVHGTFEKSFKDKET